MSERYGHRTMADGSHIPLTKQEADEIWATVERARSDRAIAMPTAKDALDALIQAEARLRELGWAKGGGLRVKRGDDCAVATQGSTGMWSGHVDDEGEYVHYCDSVSKPRDAFLKPLPDLTEDERAWMTQCDESERRHFERTLNAFASALESPND